MVEYKYNLLDNKINNLLQEVFIMNIQEKLLLDSLNLKPNEIESVQFCSHSIYVKLLPSASICPCCGSSRRKSKGFYNRTIKTTKRIYENYSVYLKLRRYTCLNCSHSYSDDKYIAPQNYSVSYNVIFEIMRLLQDPKMTIKQVAKLTNTSETTVTRIFDKHCHISRYTFPEVICIDEVYTKNSDFKAKYSCLFYDFYNHKIIDILPDRKKDYLHYYFQPLMGSKELDNVKYICIDMYLPYKQICEVYFKKAIICVDSFHVIKTLNDGLSRIRIRLLKSFESGSKEYYLLKMWRYLLFKPYDSFDINEKRKFNKAFNQYLNRYQLRELLLDIHPDLRIGYTLKELYVDFNRFCSLEEAPTQLDNVIESFVSANIPEYNDFITAITNWREEIINSFTLYRGKRINNGVAESINAQVKLLLYNTRGIRNHERRRKRIMYAINKEGFSIK